MLHEILICKSLVIGTVLGTRRGAAGQSIPRSQEEQNPTSGNGNKFIHNLMLLFLHGGCRRCVCESLRADQSQWAQRREARELGVVSHLETMAQGITKLLVHSLHDERRTTDAAHAEIAAPVTGAARVTRT